MLLEGILSISGQPGLFKLISKGKQNVIVESLSTGKRMPAFSTSRISTLEDVAIYTEDGDVPLTDIIIEVFNKYGKEIEFSSKSSASELSGFLESVLPNYDKDRVYQSDIKKLVNWYKQLVEFEIVTEDAVKKHIEAEKEKENQDAESPAEDSDENNSSE